MASDPSITGGGRFGVLPAEVSADRRMSGRARWLFGLLCTHARRSGHCRLALTRIASAEAVSVRSIQRWLRELEAAGRVVREPVPGQADVYRVVRDPDQVPAARRHNAERLAKRRQRFARAVDNPRDKGTPAARCGQGGGDTDVTTVVTRMSPPGPAVVSPVSPPSEQEITKRVQQDGPGPNNLARQGGGRRRRAQPADSRQTAMLMPIAGGRATANPSDASEDDEVALVVRVVLAVLSALRGVEVADQDLVRAAVDQARAGRDAS